MAKKTYKFDDTVYVTAYELARDGHSDTQVAKAMGVTYLTFRAWKRKYPALVDALERARRYKTPTNNFTFQDYVYERLEPEHRAMWDSIMAWETIPGGYEMIEAMLANEGTQTRQALFIHALTQTAFNISKAMRLIGVPRRVYEDWRKNDPDFAALVEEIFWHKKNFFEQAFIGRVAAGDTPAIIHAVKTQCRDRGYNDKIEVEYSGTVDHTHTIDLATLDLDVTTRRAILEAMRKRDNPEGPQYAQVVG